MEDQNIKKAKNVIRVLEELPGIYKDLLDVYKGLVYGEKPSISDSYIKDSVEQLEIGKKCDIKSYDDLIDSVAESIEGIFYGVKLVYGEDYTNDLKDAAVLIDGIRGAISDAYITTKGNSAKDTENLAKLSTNLKNLSDLIRPVAKGLENAKKTIED